MTHATPYHNHKVKHDTAHDRSLTGETRQRIQYGGLNLGASFFGWLVANSVSVLTVSLLSALGAAVALTAANGNSQELASSAQTVGVVGGTMLLIAFGLAYYAGGYVAGRMSRFDGARQGFGVWVIGIIAAIILGVAGAVLGASFNLLQQLNLPSLPVNGQNFTVGGIITLLLVLAVTALAAIMGGKVGERYHHKVDEAGRTDIDR